MRQLSACYSCGHGTWYHDGGGCQDGNSNCRCPLVPQIVPPGFVGAHERAEILLDLNRRQEKELRQARMDLVDLEREIAALRTRLSFSGDRPGELIPIIRGGDPQ